MKSLQDYIAEGIFNNIGAGEWEIEEGEIREWLEKSRLRVNFNDLITKGYNNSPHPLIKSDAITPGVHGHIEITNRPELFPDHCWPEFIRFASAPECGLEVSGCGLETLRNMPRVYKYLNVSNNNIESLEEYGVPEIDDYVVQGSVLNICNNDLRSLKGCPKCNILWVRHNHHLQSFAGVPTNRKFTEIDARNCDLRTLEGMPKMHAHTDTLIICNNPDLDVTDGPLKKSLAGVQDIRTLAIDAPGLQILTDTFSGAVKSISICNTEGDDFLRGDAFMGFINKFSRRNRGMYVKIEGKVSAAAIEDVYKELRKDGKTCVLSKSTFYSGMYDKK